ncbi:hypothetical protein ACRYCC_28340 [Actinomadura scrupuli]|uniref:hypothetical protein n=1 Tax=Actinomadura scrupuli TaxID=559629 RepID=UPI003D99CF72
MSTTTTRPAKAAPHDRPARRSGPAGSAAGSKTAESPPAGTRRAADAGAARAPAPPARPGVPPRAPFVLLVVALLGGALVSLLLLNTVLAKDAFTLTELQQSNNLLTQQRQALQEQIAREEAPERLAQKARALGMTQPVRPAFVDARTGRVAGDTLRPVPRAAAAAAGAAGVVGVPGAVVPGDGIPGWGGGSVPPPQGGTR